MLLLIDSAAHLLVDALCAAVMLGPVRASEAFALLVLLYNTLAFSTQCLVGLAADRLRRDACAACAAMLLVVLGFALPLPAVFRVCLVGVGNSVFHVAGGAMTLRSSGGKAGSLGVFVAPGAVGLTLGTLWPQLGVLFAVLLTAAAAAVIPAARREHAEQAAPERPERGADVPLAAVLLLTAAVAVRAVGGNAVRFPWKTSAGLTLLLTAFVFAGKTAGGFVCDRLGPGRAAWLSLPAAAVLIAFCAEWAAPSLLGQFALNLTMPVTLWLLYCAMPDAPGFAFGLAASALWPGTIAGRLMTLTGPALWLCVLGSILFGLYAVLFAAKTIHWGQMKRRC